MHIPVREHCIVAPSQCIGPLAHPVVRLMPVVPLVVLSLSPVLGPGTHAEHHTGTPRHEGVAPLLESGKGTVILTVLLFENNFSI